MPAKSKAAVRKAKDPCAEFRRELRECKVELKEARAQQDAVGEILRIISDSPTDTQPVFDAIVNSGVRLFEDANISLRLVKGTNSVAVASTLPLGDDGGFPRPLDDDGSPSARAILRKEVVEVSDTLTEAWLSETARQRAKRRGFRGYLAAPMLREEAAIGVIGVLRSTPGPFTDKQIALLQTFADQAVIAIENVRLFNETKEALERQTATAEVLRVISSSPGSLEPVYRTILDGIGRLCEANIEALFVYDGQTLAAVATSGTTAEFSAHLKRSRPRPSHETTTRLAALERRVVHVADLLTDDSFAPNPRDLYERENVRTVLSVPMLREDTLVGVITAWRREVHPFTDRQIDLVRTFADQAVIAIENVRLFEELEARNTDLTEALEQQTATADILKVISSSPTDTQPVFEAIAQSGVRLFAGSAIAIALPDGDQIRAAAIAESDPERAASWRSRFPFPLSHDYMHGAAILDRRVIDIPDALNDQGEWQAGLKNFLTSGYRAVTIMPMVRGDTAIGAIGIVRLLPGPLSDKQITLLKTFADQAVIAIENVRLFNEIQEKSEQLEIANRHKSQFLANMSHELRTPLNCINGFSEMLLARMFGDLNEKQEEFLRDINSSGEHLLALINDVLDLSKIEAGRMEIFLESFDPGITFDNTVMLVKERAARRGIAVNLSVDDQLEMWVGDERKIRQVMLNLLSNAIKFTPEGGHIDVKATRDGNEMVVSVSDNGVGIKPEDQVRIFEEFQQAGSNYTKKAEGTGLGLALTKKFIELHGGTIRVESAEGKGSMFTFRLPQMQEA